MVEPDQYNTSFKPTFHPLYPKETPVLSVAERQHMFLFADKTQLESSITCGNAR